MFGTSAGLFDDAVTTRLPAAVWASATVKAIDPVAESSLIDRFDTAEIVGGLPPPTAWRKLATVLAALLIDSALLCWATVPVGAPE